MRSESLLVIPGNGVKKDNITAEDVLDECFCSRVFFVLRNLWTRIVVQIIRFRIYYDKSKV